MLTELLQSVANGVPMMRSAVQQKSVLNVSRALSMANADPMWFVNAHPQVVEVVLIGLVATGRTSSAPSTRTTCTVPEVTTSVRQVKGVPGRPPQLTFRVLSGSAGRPGALAHASVTGRSAASAGAVAITDSTNEPAVTKDTNLGRSSIRVCVCVCVCVCVTSSISLLVQVEANGTAARLVDGGCV